MFLIRVKPKLDSGFRLSPRFLFGDTYSIHKMIWSLFENSTSRKRDFIYRIERQRGLPQVFIVSDQKPEGKDDFWQIQTKPYEPKLRVDQRLSFILRANPIRTKTDEEGRHHRHDVIMEGKNKLNKNGVPRKNWPLRVNLVQKEGFSWLAARAEKHGFSIKETEVRVDGYQQHRFHKSKQAKPVSISSLEFSGVLTVTNPEVFLETLYHGIGPAKGFGFGMIMVKRIL